MRDCPKHPNVPPEIYYLTDLLIGDLECARVIAQGIMKAQLNIEGQKNLTCSGYTQVRCVRFDFGALVCHGNFGLHVSLKKL